MRRKRSLVGAMLLAAAVAAPAAALAQAPDPKTVPARTDQLNRITIEVTGGEKEVPVENASVYLKYVEERKILKDKKKELNVKTNREGRARIPDAPVGKVLIQIVADGWKTYGRWVEITEANQVIKVHLERPPKWY